MYVCKYIYIIYIISKFWDSVKYPSGVAAFGPVLAGVFALFGQETSDVAEIDKSGTEEAGKVLLVFLVIFLGRLFSKYALVKGKPKQAMGIGVGTLVENTRYCDL